MNLFFVEAPSTTWWIDSSSTIHIVNTMQGFLNTSKPASNEQQVYYVNKLFSHVEVVGTFRLILKSGYVLDLDNVFCIPCFSRNLNWMLLVLVFGLSIQLSVFFKGEHFIGGG
jgi:hypothetical protein